MNLTTPCLLALLFVVSLFSSASAQNKIYKSSTIAVAVERDNTEPVIEIISIENTDRIKVRVQDPGGIDTVWIDNRPRLAHQLTIFEDSVSAATEHTIRAVDRYGNYAYKKPSSRNISTEKTHIPPGLAGERLIAQAKYYALIIGVEQYTDNRFTDLEYPVDNANDLKEVLNNYYFFDQENVSVLKNPSKREIESSLDRLRRQVKDNGNLLIFFAGHGLYDKVSESAFWIPSDAVKDDYSTYVRVSTVQDYIREVKSQHTLVVVDACYSGSIYQTRGPGINVVPSDIQTLYTKKSRAAMTSSTLDEVPDKSVFMKYFLQELENNRKKYMPANMLFNSFKSTVIKNTQRYKIIPQYRHFLDTGDEGGEFIFTRNQTAIDISR